MSKKYPKTPVMAIIYDEPKPRKVLLKRKVAQTLRALVDRGELGITALEMSNTWALRIADYVFSLRHNHKIGILMVREPHDDGWHGRYILQSNVTLQEPENGG